jgi:hypothetical protein
MRRGRGCAFFVGAIRIAGGIAGVVPVFSGDQLARSA